MTGWMHNIFVTNFWWEQKYNYLFKSQQIGSRAWKFRNGWIDQVNPDLSSSTLYSTVPSSRDRNDLASDEKPRRLQHDKSDTCRPSRRWSPRLHRTTLSLWMNFGKFRTKCLFPMTRSLFTDELDSVPATDVGTRPTRRRVGPGHGTLWDASRVPDVSGGTYLCMYTSGLQNWFSLFFFWCFL